VRRMRGLSTKLTLAAAATVAAAVALPVSAAATHGPLSERAAAAPLANSVTFEDSRGEDSAGPDITDVAVSNNDAGLITFRIAVPNRPTLSPDMLAIMFVDSDNQSSTGDPDIGSEYVVQLFQGSVDLFRWDGNDYSRTGVAQSSLIYSYANGVLTIKVSAADLGNTKQFAFATIVISGLAFNPNTGDFDDTNAHRDLAPDAGHGLYSYQVKLAPLRLVVRSFSESPTRPVAGRSFSAFLTAARSDTGAVLKGGRVTCVATVGGRRLAATRHAVVGGRATCTWAIPASVRGQTIRGSVTVSFEGLTARKSFSARVG